VARDLRTAAVHRLSERLTARRESERVHVAVSRRVEGGHRARAHRRRRDVRRLRGPAAAPRFTRAFHDGGGRRILFGCSRAGCEAPRRPLVAALDGGGIDARIVYAGNVGHTVDAAVVASVQRELGWLLAGDPRFPP